MEEAYIYSNEKVMDTGQALEAIIVW